MAFKGGTCLQKIYIRDYRFSDDLDFTLTENISVEKIGDIFEGVCRRANQGSGIDFRCEPFTVVENGYQGKIDFRMVWKGGNPIKIKLDITHPNNEEIILPPKKRSIFQKFEGMENNNVLCYELKEILAEKVRSLFQRTRPRDLYDVWSLSSQISLKDLEDIISKKFHKKQVEMDMEDMILRESKFESAWNNSLRHQLKSVPEFPRVFPMVLERLNDLEILVNPSSKGSRS